MGSPVTKALAEVNLGAGVKTKLQRRLVGSLQEEHRQRQLDALGPSATEMEMARTGYSLASEEESQSPTPPPTNELRSQPASPRTGGLCGVCLQLRLCQQCVRVRDD